MIKEIIFGYYDKKSLENFYIVLYKQGSRKTIRKDILKRNKNEN